jgi:hypothetical protein
VKVDLEVDGRGPTWLSMAPKDGSWSRDTDVEAWADLTDNDGVGLDPFSLEYQVEDPAIGTWGPWTAARLVLGGGEGGSSRGITALMLAEAEGHAIRWRAKDVLGNGPTTSASVTFGVDVSEVTLEPHAESDWIRGTEASVTCLVTDPDPGLGSSGVDVGTVEFSVLVSISGGWTDWTAPDSLVQVEGTTTVQATARIPLAEGSDNFVRWRARDTAGNNLVVSPPDMMKVDTTVPVLVSHWPRGGTLDRPEDGRAVATFSDGAGSGIDPGSVEISLTLGSAHDYGDWTPVEATGDPNDLMRAEVKVEGLDGHDNWVMWRVADEAGNGPVEFGPFRLMVNLPPTAAIASPSEGGSFGTGDIVVFSSEGSSDPDPEDKLTFEWWSDIDGPLGSGPEIRTPLTPGEHRCTLYVDDGLGGDHVSRASVTVKVAEPTHVQEPLDLWFILLIVLVAAVTVATLRELRARRRRRLDGLV